MSDRHLISISVALLMLAGCASFESADEVQQVLVPVYFITDRNIVASTDSSAVFGPDRGEVQQGVTQVALTSRRHADAVLAEPAGWQSYDRRISRDILLDTALLSEQEFYAGLLDSAEQTSEKATLVVYIHGYNRSYESAVLDTADLMYEINLSYPLVLYSWPSGGSVLSYASDLVNTDWSTYHLSAFLEKLLDNEAIGKLHIIAHSLGNRALLNSLKYLTDSQKLSTPEKIGQLILFAPDVDADIFSRDYLPVLASLADRTSLYVNAKDVPLQTSNRLNRYQRLGNASEKVFIASGVETVEISDAVTIFNSHDAHLEIPRVQQDLHALLNLQQAAAQRKTLAPSTDEAGRPYWKLLGP